MRNFGRWLGDRYRNDDNVVWLTVGEATLPASPLPMSKVRAIADGIREGDTGDKLLSVHMRTGSGLHALRSYGTALAGYDFVDFNMADGQECCRSLPGGSTHWGIIENDGGAFPPSQQSSLKRSMRTTQDRQGSRKRLLGTCDGRLTGASSLVALGIPTVVTRYGRAKGCRNLRTSQEQRRWATYGGCWNHSRC